MLLTGTCDGYNRSIQVENRTYFFSLTISDIIVLITPTFPFKAPPIIRKTKACQNVLENPNPRHEIMVPNRPTREDPLTSYNAETGKSLTFQLLGMA
jgi:hypothetical protein